MMALEDELAEGMRNFQLGQAGKNALEAFEAAEKAFTRAVQIEPTFPMAYMGRAEARTHLARWKSIPHMSSRDLAKAKSVEFHYYQLAVDDLTHAIELKPPQDLLAICHAKRAEYSLKAIEESDDAYDIFPLVLRGLADCAAAAALTSDDDQMSSEREMLTEYIQLREQYMPKRVKKG